MVLKKKEKKRQFITNVQNNFKQLIPKIYSRQ